MTRPTLLLLPGLLCDRTVWEPQIEALAATAEIIVPHFWGQDSFETMARTALEIAPPRFAVAGHSMGGRVALEIMRLAPERVDRLAVLDTGVHPVRPEEIGPRKELVALAEREGMAALV
ncbi:MAG TPA: alpha/beta fold hydrolase, partial [Stellaceae bacterium]|nr:alpha/beta fold hydrolase [Stellaceae bacterium]